MTPESKYNLTEEPQLQFFNYHEYMSKEYLPVHESQQPQDEQTPIVVNHFVNVYSPPGSVKYHTTRIIRIPRVFDTIQYPDLIPQFSNIYPGKEPARIDNGIEEFTPEGIYDNSVFGTSSLTPLIPELIKYEDFKSIIDHINQLLYKAYDPFSWTNGLENTLNILLANLFHELFTSASKKTLRELETYITTINKTFSQVRFVSPASNGYLSVRI